MEQAFNQVAGQYGIAIAVLAAVLVVLCVFLWTVVRWLKPWAEKTIQSHINLTNETTEAVAKWSALPGTLSQILESQMAIARSVQQIHQDGCKWGRQAKGGDE